MLIGFYKPRNKNVLQLQSKDDGPLLFNRTMSCPKFQKIQAWHLMMQAQEEQEVIIN